MKRASVAVAPIVIALLAGCGSSSKTTSSSTGSAAASTPAQSTSTPTPSTTAPTQSTPTPAPSASTPSAPGSITVTTKGTSRGPILAAGPKRLTVYMFEADTIPTMSVCGPNCAAVWPPLTTRSQPHASGETLASGLRTITRPDGRKQVTYKGHPLYYYVRDGDASDAYGQGIKSFGASWYVLSPTGNKIDKS
jgi:predicted lipoprotein with Yx(FWY)xxD motif